MNEKTIVITPEEAMLIDWVLTMHAFDTTRLEQLQEERMVGLRRKVALPIVQESDSSISFTPEEIRYLLITIPITFRFYKEDIGFSLKRKLLATLIPPQIDWGIVEKKDDNQDNASKDRTKGLTEGIP